MNIFQDSKLSSPIQSTHHRSWAPVLSPLLSGLLILPMTACQLPDLIALNPSPSPTPISSSTASPSPGITPTPQPSATPLASAIPLASATPTASPVPAGSFADQSGLWNVFKDPAGQDLSLNRIRWFSASEGMGARIRGTKASLFQTVNGGKSWQLVSEIDGQNTAYDASMDVYIFSANDIWYTTAFAGFGISGTIGRSTDGGKTWTSLTEAVHKALADPDAKTIYDLPLFNIVKSQGRIYVSAASDYLAVSDNQAQSWSRLKTPLTYSSENAPDLIGTPDYLMLYYFKNKQNQLFRYSEGHFVSTEAQLPDSDDRLWYRSVFSNNGVTFVNRRIYPWWGYPVAVQATGDGGKTFQKVFYQASKDNETLGLRDAKYFVNGSQGTTYLSGIFKGLDGKEYSQIRKRADGESSYSVVHSQPAGQQGYTSVQLDALNQIHAVRHWTDYYGNEYNHDAQYALIAR